VVLAKKIDSTIGAPKPAMDLHAGTYNYQVKLEAGGQQMNMKASTAIQDGANSWTATNQLDTPQGTATDTATLEKGSLVLLKRSVKQGPVAIDLDFGGNRALGKMSMNGQDRPIAVDLGGPLFADAAGAGQVIACLPLAEGYSTTFRNFDVQTQKVKLFQLAVAGKEQITVPAGTFDTLRVEISAADGDSDKKTFWIANETHKVVKVTAVLASMGGAVMTQELVQ
jgi:hypothetical protein